MPNTDPLPRLILFRRAAYHFGLGHRKDTLFELLEALLTSPGPTSLVRLSLTPVFRRRWPSAPDALTDGRLHPDWLRALLVRHLPPLTGARPLWAVDGTTWPRPAATTSPARTWGRRVTPGQPQDGVIPAWEYQWLVAVPEAQGSWVLPLDLRRRGPGAATPTALAIDQIQTARALQPPGSARPVVTFDTHYDVAALVRAHLAADCLVRLASNRVLYHAPPPYPGKGRPRRHGPAFRLADPTTHGPPDRSARRWDPDYGWVQVDAWVGLHGKTAYAAPFTVVRVQVERLPRRATPPAPLWLAWTGAVLPAGLLDLWRQYRRRFTCEHGFRFAKPDLGWTTVRPRDPAAADRWSWLVALAFWQLWLARPVVADARLPWERPVAPAHLTPGRVRREFAGLLLQLGTPARPPIPRGKSPGRQRGQCPGPHPRLAVVRRHPKTPRRRRTRAA